MSVNAQAWLALLLAAAFVGSCAKPLPGPDVPAKTTTACPKVQDAHRFIDASLAAGRLERTLGAIEDLTDRCPEQEASLNAVWVDTLAEIGRYDQARALAHRIQRDGDDRAKTAARRALALIERRTRKLADAERAKAEMRRLWVEAKDAEDHGRHKHAQELYLAAWESWHPFGDALYAAGRNARLSGHQAAAQRLFDRALVELERGGQVARVRWYEDNHAADTTAAGLSPDGVLLATGESDGAVRIWDIAHGKLLRTLFGHYRPITAAAVTGDGRVASAGGDHVVRLWSPSGKQIRVFELPWVQTMAMNRDLLVMASQDKRLWFWSTKDSVPREITAHRMEVTSVALAANVVATGSLDGSVRIWDATSGALRRTIFVREPVQSVALSPDGALLLSAGKNVKLWDVGDGTLLRNRYHEARTATLRGNWIAAVDTSHKLSLWALDTGRVELQKEDVGDFALIAPQMLLTDGDMGIGLWNHTGEHIGTLRSVVGADAGYLVTPNGEVDISGSVPDAARDALRCQIGERSFPFELCEDRLLFSGLLERVTKEK
jgi:WD domain, G-beta repeat